MTEDRPVAPPTRARVYRVSVAGDLGPALQAALADLHPTPRRPSTLLRLQLPAGRTITDVAALLEECGLELLTLRVVPDSGQ
jgi:hypothetical protein